MKQYKIVVPANGSDYRDVGGDFIRIDSATGLIKLRAETMDGRLIADLNMTQGKQVSLPERFEKVRLTNLTGSEVTAVLEVGNGEISDNELTGTITASQGTSIGNGSHTVNTTALKILNASSGRRSIVLLNSDAANAVYIGGAGVTTLTGLPLLAGQSMNLDHAAAGEIYAIAGAAGVVVKSLTESD